MTSADEKPPKPLATAAALARRAVNVGGRYGLLPVRGLQGERFGRSLAAANVPPADGWDPDVTADPDNPLERYFDEHREGPGIWKFRHYFEIYHKHFAPFIGKKPTLLEIGIYSGGSLGMWRDYFGEGVRIIGVDIEDACRVYESDDTTVYIGDQADRSFWADFRKKEPTVDLVVDDGGHHPTQQIRTLEEVLPHMSAGGVYICEDLQRRYNPFVRYVEGLARNLHQRNYVQANPIQQAIESVTFYPYVTVITRRSRPMPYLQAPKHGTEWQPFLGDKHLSDHSD